MATNDYRFDRADFGERIEGVQGDVDVWWCEATWKVHQDRPTPEGVAKNASISTARNDHEALQIVVRPKKALQQLTATAGELTGPGGACIPAKNIQVLRAYYHQVQIPSDRLSPRGWWPDALPPLDKPVDLAAEKNQPLWFLVNVPQDAQPGDYTGKVTLKAEGWNAVVPIKLHVWNFTLPEQNHIETAFGLGMSDKLHHLTTEADKRQVWDMYMQCFADHRLSPYDPVPFDPFKVKFVMDADPARAEIDFSAFDKAMTRAIEKYHINTFRLPVEGVGGSLGSFGKDTPQYQAAFSSQMKQLESHFREKDWLKIPYVYWTDEPLPKNYPDVQAGMERLKKDSPDIQTMITTNWADETLHGPIDIWCPDSFNYKPEAAQKRMAAGARYWWYLCTLPRAPYVTLFIDHPATEMRVWVWQTWQRDIRGLLVWHTTYWSPRGDVEQNPYEDPMGYVSGAKPDEKKYWGNGDGRLLYPPLAAMAPGASENKAPILEPPVSCIRLEMLREGIEDYEFLWQLRDLIEKKKASLTAEQVKHYEALLQVPDEITSSMTSFTTDAKPIYARRAAIAEAIEQLQKIKG
jgi:hypothetical protein